ncbi:MFS transporter [Salinicola acroporae]|uniref:MFS transporter n=1 Tax=Salinicola acroporae TaxID=1541440 RepID=UPI0013A631C3|nr:MFS transporter [Salinicola acroporae]
MLLAITRAANDLGIAPGEAIASVATPGYGAKLLDPAAIGFASHPIGLHYAFALLGALALPIAALAIAMKRLCHHPKTTTPGRRALLGLGRDPLEPAIHAYIKDQWLTTSLLSNQKMTSSPRRSVLPEALSAACETF